MGAITWLIGLPLVGMASAIPSDAEFFLIGLIGTVLGCSLVPVTLGPGFNSSNHKWLILGWTGAALSGVLAAASALLILGARGDLGARAPEWIADLAEFALIALFGWIVVASALSRRSPLGQSAYLLGVVSGGAFLALLLLSAASAIPGFIITNAIAAVDLVLALLVWLTLPAWLLVVAWRTTPRPN
jgi:hypothetical protein